MEGIDNTLVTTTSPCKSSETKNYDSIIVTLVEICEGSMEGKAFRETFLEKVMIEPSHKKKKDGLFQKDKQFGHHIEMVNAKAQSIQVHRIHILSILGKPGRSDTREDRIAR